MKPLSAQLQTSNVDVVLRIDLPPIVFATMLWEPPGPEKDEKQDMTSFGIARKTLDALAIASVVAILPLASQAALAAPVSAPGTGTGTGSRDRQDA